MKITLESTTKIIELVVDGVGIPVRIWEGQTEDGIPVHCYVPRIAVPDGRSADDYARFAQQLQECRKPSPPIEAIPLRLIL